MTTCSVTPGGGALGYFLGGYVRAARDSGKWANFL